MLIAIAQNHCVQKMNVSVLLCVVVRAADAMVAGVGWVAGSLGWGGGQQINCGE